MFERALDQIGNYPHPPTPEHIERLRQEQFEALRKLRRWLLDVQTDNKDAA